EVVAHGLDLDALVVVAEDDRVQLLLAAGDPLRELFVVEPGGFGRALRRFSESDQPRPPIGGREEVGPVSDAGPRRRTPPRARVFPCRPADGSDGERTTAAATAAGVRIVEGEAGTLEGGHVVDLHPPQVLHAEGIHEKPETVHLQHEIVVRRFILDVEAVLEPGAPAGQHAHAEPRILGGAVLLHVLADLRYRGPGHRDRRDVVLSPHWTLAAPFVTHRRDPENPLGILAVRPGNAPWYGRARELVVMTYNHNGTAR